MYDPIKARAAQNEYCARTRAPHFAPENGKCWCCNRNIYEPLGKTNSYNGQTYTTGITVEYASERLVTGCPHCNRSYCD